jgi:AGCS family alanine or glycine:cation symporter
MPDVIRSAIFWTSDFVWGPWNTPIGPIPGPLMFLLILTGLFLTIRTGVVQVRRFPEAVRTIVPKASASASGALSPFQAFMTALAASIGTGNIAGVATAIVSGGPGALFWIWAYGFIAMAIKFAEAVLGMHFRVVHDRGSSSGPMYYLRDGLKAPRLAAAFALIAGLAALFTTPFTQPNSMAVVLKSQFGLPTWVAGVAIAVLTWLVIIGGVTSIGKAAEKLSPLKVGLYFAGGLFVILSHASQLPAILALVFREAFSFKAAAGSSAGIGIILAMRYGLARGIYANEAGYGTAAVAYGTARSKTPTQQGLNGVIEVFIVSFVTSSISALTILVSGAAQQSIAAIRQGGAGLTSTAVVAQAFNTAIPVAGGWVVAFCAFLFGYTTLIGWAYYGEQFFEYLFGVRVTVPYRWIYCLLIPIGATASVETVWAWGDLMNGLQVFPNLVGLVGLSGIVAVAARASMAKARD